MSDDEDKLALVGEEPQRRFFVDSCVFYLVDEDDRAVTDAARSAIISAGSGRRLGGLNFFR